MRILTFLALTFLLLATLSSAATVYNDPEVFWTRNHAAFFTDPATNQQMSTQRLSNDQLRIYLRDDGVRTQLGLPVLEKKVATRNIGMGPAATYQPYVTLNDIDRNTYKAIQGPGQTPLRKKGPKYFQPPLTYTSRVAAGYDETQWIYQNTQRIHDKVMHRNYRSDYYGDENLYNMLNNNRVRYQPWGQPKYYD